MNGWEKKNRSSRQHVNRLIIFNSTKFQNAGNLSLSARDSVLFIIAPLHCMKTANTTAYDEGLINNCLPVFCRGLCSGRAGYMFKFVPLGPYRPFCGNWIREHRTFALLIWTCRQNNSIHICMWEASSQTESFWLFREVRLAHTHLHERLFVRTVGQTEPLLTVRLELLRYNLHIVRESVIYHVLSELKNTKPFTNNIFRVPFACICSFVINWLMLRAFGKERIFYSYFYRRTLSTWTCRFKGQILMAKSHPMSTTRKMLGRLT